MCNIAAYVGERRAAPILIEMLRAQEGLNAGFFTGMATMHEGKIHWRKIEGDVEYFLAHTDAADLPGNIGIIHGRTPGSGGDAWAHPFIGWHGAQAEIACVFNGARGCFASRSKDYDAIALSLERDGYVFGSKTPIGEDPHRILPDGTTVHTSDAVTQLILRHMDQGEEEALAMENAFCEMPVEFVSLMLSRRHPDRIFWAMINKPMMRGVAPHGTYLASCAIAFPEDAGPARYLPFGSSGYVTANSFKATAFKQLPATIAPIDAMITAKVFDYVTAQLREGERTLTELAIGARALFDEAECNLATPLVYEVLYALNKRDMIAFRTGRITHKLNQKDAPCTYMRLKEK